MSKKYYVVSTDGANYKVVNVNEGFKQVLGKLSFEDAEKLCDNMNEKARKEAKP